MNSFPKASTTKAPYFYKQLFKLYLFGISVFFLLRLFLLYYVTGINIGVPKFLYLFSLTIGFQYDTVVLSYALAFPLLLLFVDNLFQNENQKLNKLAVYFISFTLPLLFAIAVADIPYFQFFKSRLTESSFQWFESPKIMFYMIISTWANLSFLILSIFLFAFSVFLLFRFCKKSFLNVNNSESITNKSKILWFLGAVLLLFIGMRGKIDHPIRQDDVFFCQDPVLNQVGLNPAFSILKSYTSKVELMNSDVAISTTQQLLSIHSPIQSISPIARQVIVSETVKKHNIVLVLMESMSARYLTKFGNKKKLAPNLDSLTQNSWFFNNAFSAGIHTNNGIFSSLYSLPALKRVRPLSTVPIRTYSGLPYTLKQNGYKNMFFCTHNESFDNLGGFIPANYFDELYTAEDFPKDKIVGPYGVPDDYLFQNAIQKLSLVKENEPFFATILTTSNHDPYILPDYFQSANQNKQERAVQYADWSIGQFLKEAKKQPWFDNTIFVFVADHGVVVGENPFDLPLSYNHIPIIMHAPKLLQPKQFDQFLGQIDIFPTLMGMLKVSYINNTLGQNIFQNPRKCMYFSSDDKLGCIDNRWLYVYHFGGREVLYDYKTGNTTDFKETEKAAFEKLKNAAFAQTQVAEWMIANDKTKIK